MDNPDYPIRSGYPHLSGCLPDGGIRLIFTIPRGSPKLVKQNTTDGMSLDKPEQDLPKYTMKLQDSEMAWWRKFITNYRNGAISCQKRLKNGAWVLW